MTSGVKIDREHLKPVPVGKSDWEGFCQTNYTVDKTLLVKELLDDDTGVVIEMKAAKTARQGLKKLAQEARDQIDQKNYAAEMSAAGVTDILKLGLAYYKRGGCKTSVPTWEGRALSRPRTGRSPSLPRFCNCLKKKVELVLEAKL